MKNLIQNSFIIVIFDYHFQHLPTFFVAEIVPVNSCPVHLFYLRSFFNLSIVISIAVSEDVLLSSVLSSVGMCTGDPYERKYSVIVIENFIILRRTIFERS
jgi:hypothetical protein